MKCVIILCLPLHLQSLSSQSLPAHVYGRENTLTSQHSPPSSLYNYPLHSQMKPTPSSYAVPLANSTLLGHSHISTSNSSINSIKSVESAVRTHAIHAPQDYAFSRYHLPSNLSTQHTSRAPLSSTPRYLSSGREVPTTRNPQPAYYKYPHDHASVAKQNPAQSRRAPLRQGAPANMDDGPRGQRGLISASSDGKALPDVELNKSKLKIKQLQKEVS